MPGPHQGGTYREWVLAEFEQRNWALELQAPQGPYTNVLGLYLFPGLLRRRSEIIQLYNSTEANMERTWNTVLGVWGPTSSAGVPRAFVLAQRVMRLIIEENGNNSWLSEGTPHCNARQGYIDTNAGARRRIILNIGD